MKRLRDILGALSYVDRKGNQWKMRPSALVRFLLGAPIRRGNGKRMTNYTVK